MAKIGTQKPNWRGRREASNAPTGAREAAASSTSKKCSTRKTLFQRLGVNTPEDYDKAGQWQWKTGWMEAVRLLTQSQGGIDTYGFDGRSGIHFINARLAG